MNLNTYRSTLDQAVFVTLPSNCSNATIGVVDELRALQLDPVRLEYEPAGDRDHAAFARFVLTEIVLKGYATHDRYGFAFAGRRPR